MGPFSERATPIVQAPGVPVCVRIWPFSAYSAYGAGKSVHRSVETSNRLEEFPTVNESLVPSGVHIGPHALSDPASCRDVPSTRDKSRIDAVFPSVPT
jgi:hypothetical protein